MQGQRSIWTRLRDAWRVLRGGATPHPTPMELDLIRMRGEWTVWQATMLGVLEQIDQRYAKARAAESRAEKIRAEAEAAQRAPEVTDGRTTSTTAKGRAEHKAQLRRRLWERGQQ